MKKTIYSLFVMLFAVIGCTKEWNQDSLKDTSVIPEGAKATVVFSIPAQPATKAPMSVQPGANGIENLYVAVFNSAGQLKEYTEATPIQKATANGEWKTYKVDLMLSSTERRLHFIANAPSSLESGSESVVIRGLENSVGDDAASYWQRVVLTDGVTPYAYKGGVVTINGVSYGTEGANSYVDSKGVTVNVGDFIREDGTKVTDGTGYIASEETQTALYRIPLIRNYARVTVTGKAGGSFEPVSFIVVNVPSKGYLAPYDSKANDYVKPYTDAYAKVAQNYIPKLEEIKASGYSAEMPTDATLIKYTKAQINAMQFKSAGEWDFMFERAIPTTEEEPTCVLVSGYLTDNDHDPTKLRWFKIEITDEDGNYLPIFRDVTYEMCISSIVGTPGWDTAWEAYDNLSVGDVSTSTTTATLNQISDGRGTTLWVEYIDYSSVEPDGETATILYKLFTDDGENLTGQTITVSGTTKPRVSLTVDPGSNPAISSTTVTGSSYSGTDTPDGQSGWYVAEVPLLGQGGSLKKSTLTIEGITKAGNGTKAVLREVTYRVYPTLKFTDLQKDWVTVDNVQNLKLSITLPKDLGFSLFPLVLKIEANEGDLNPSVSMNNRGNVFGDTETDTKSIAVDLPTEYGQSMFGGSNNTFYFLFTINYSDYDPTSDNNTYTLYFKKTRTSDNSTKVGVRDKKPYFEMKDVAL